jgi:uncharacterized RDD family membrane protein YckC
MSPTNWYYARGGQQIGPITLDALRQQASAGALEPGDLVWGEGMPDWVDARQVPELASSFASAGPEQGEYDVAPGTSAPPSPAVAPYPAPGVPTYAAPQYPAAPYPGAAQSGVLPYGTYQQQPGSQSVQYAGFWIRFAAALIDGIITGITGCVLGGMIGFAIGIASSGSRDPRGAQLALQAASNVLGIVLGWLYEAMFTSSAYQATPGKMAVGIRVVDEGGQRISFGRATGRYFGKIISGLICGFGYFMAGWDERKQSLHDKMASTLVVYK